MLRKVLLMLCSSALVSAGIIGTDYSPATSVSYSSVSTPTLVKTVATPIIQKSYDAPIGYTKTIQTPPSYESLLTTKESKFESPDGTQHSAFSKSFNTAYSNVNKIEPKSSGDAKNALQNAISGIYSNDFHSPIVYHPHTGYTYPTPLVQSAAFSKPLSYPVTYTTHNIPLTKTILSPSITSYASPVVSHTKVINSGLTSHYTPSIHTFNSPVYTKSVSLPVTYTSHEVPLTKTIISPSYTSYTTPVVSKTKDLSSGLSSYSSHSPVIEAQPIKTTFTYSEAPIVSHMSFSGLGTSYAW